MDGAASPPAAVGAYIGAAYFFTSSTSFANPAITVGRMFSNTFAGIAPSSVPAFIAAQIVGGALAVGVIKVLYPGITPAEAADIIVPHHSLDGPDTEVSGAGVAPDGAPSESAHLTQSTQPSRPPGDEPIPLETHAHHRHRRKRRRYQRRLAGPRARP